MSNITVIKNTETLQAELRRIGFVFEETAMEVSGDEPIRFRVLHWRETKEALSTVLERAAVIAAKQDSPACKHIKHALEALQEIRDERRDREQS